MDHSSKIMIEVNPDDLQEVIHLARQSVDRGKLGELDGDDFDHCAAIGSVSRSLERAIQKRAS